MNNNPQIEISKEAYTNLLKLLLAHKEYNCVKFSYVSSCCKNAKVDILLDEINKNDFIEKYNDISIVYSRNIKDNIKSIQLKYENSTFMLKCEPFDNSSKSSASCSKGGCSGCSKGSSCSSECTHHK
ncbi:hypothetical protein [Clostridium arbusti]|uniref:hypothetical protein n=1 Tax=Clostridium arbusti TaxID=1137848 RepID=UPI000287DB4C|nr:hypothetical protein [Clostridium arbusti]